MKHRLTEWKRRKNRRRERGKGRGGERKIERLGSSTHWFIPRMAAKAIAGCIWSQGPKLPCFWDGYRDLSTWVMFSCFSKRISRMLDGKWSRRGVHQPPQGILVLCTVVPRATPHHASPKAYYHNHFQVYGWVTLNVLNIQYNIFRTFFIVLPYWATIFVPCCCVTVFIALCKKKKSYFCFSISSEFLIRAISTYGFPPPFFLVCKFCEWMPLLPVSWYFLTCFSGFVV